jgi:hypothetical protein
MRRLERAEERWYQYQNALRNLPETEANLEQNTKTLAAREQQIAALTRSRIVARRVSRRLRPNDRSISEANRVLEEQRREEREAGTELGRQQNKLEMCAQQEEERGALDEQRKKRRERIACAQAHGDGFRQGRHSGAHHRERDSRDSGIRQ